MDITAGVRSTLKTLAPTIYRALHTSAAHIALESISQRINVPVEQVLAAIQTPNVDMFANIKQAEKDFKDTIKTLSLDISDLEKNTKQSIFSIPQPEWTPKVLAYSIILLYFCVQIFVISGHIIPVSMHDIVIRSLGTLDATVCMVFSYYFGSSISSRDKTYQIENLTRRDDPQPIYNQGPPINRLMDRAAQQGK